MTDELSKLIYDFLSASEPKLFWRAKEIHEKLISDDMERILEVKSILEAGVDDSTYERLIKKVKKRNVVAYRVKRTVKDVGKDAIKDTRVDLSGWERKKDHDGK